MPLDAICLAAVRNELAGRILGLKVDKVRQPERDIIILSLKGPGVQTHRLLISVRAGAARVHLTEHKFDNPKSPAMFCMLLKKHLGGARIKDVTQPPSERLLTLELETSDAMGVKSEKSLVIELIGHQANIVLKDSGGLIIDCLRRVGSSLSEKRPVLPGLIYRNPELQEGKLNPLNITVAELNELINNENASTVDKLLISTFTGMSPLICRELSWRAYGETDYRIERITDGGDALCSAFQALMQQVKSNAYEPWMILVNDNTPYDFAFTHIAQYETAYKTKLENSFSEMLDSFYTRSEQRLRISQKCSATLKLMKTAYNRLFRKLSVQRLELEETSKQDYLRECGDIITSNLHRIKRGQEALSAEDYYSQSGKLRVIKLDPLKTPSQNSAKYYKAYTKAKNARIFLTEQIKTGETELDYIESVIEQLKRTETAHELDEIRSELTSTGYIKAHTQKRSKQAESVHYKFISASGMRIYVGKNNMQNDKLTLKTASKSDIWLHAQKIHGAHVIISCAGEYPDEKTLSEAASIAAYYSSARSDTKVPVDYTFAGKVKKPPGGRPGMVIYTDFKTIFAVPDEELVKQLRESR